MLKVPSPSKGLYKRPRSTKCLRRLRERSSTRPERSVNNVGAQVLETKGRYRIKIKPTIYERLQTPWIRPLVQLTALGASECNGPARTIRTKSGFGESTSIRDAS